ncbi:hypothetical protein IWZ01DRAFT_482558 [Phyllosticta capitalensis]
MGKVRRITPSAVSRSGRRGWQQEEVDDLVYKINNLSLSSSSIPLQHYSGVHKKKYTRKSGSSGGQRSTNHMSSIRSFSAAAPFHTSATSHRTCSYISVPAKAILHPKISASTMARVTRAHMTSGDRWIDRKRRQLKLAAAAIKTAKTGVVIPKPPPTHMIKNYEDCSDNLKKQKLGCFKRIARAWGLEGEEIEDSCANFKTFIGDLMPLQQPAGKTGIGLHNKPSHLTRSANALEFKNPLDLGKDFLYALALFAEETHDDKDTALVALRKARTMRWASRKITERAVQEVVRDDIHSAKVLFARLQQSARNGMHDDDGG